MAERGSDGQLNIIYWQAPSTLNPYLSGGTKEVESASLVLESMARFDSDGNLVPFMAESIPTVDNGGVAEDLTSITWTLREGLLWSDGTAVTANDAVFTWQYCTHPEGGCAQASYFDGVESVEALDDRTVRVNFAAPKPFPYTAFVGSESPIIQAAQFADCLGAAAPECTDANFGPIGTGPFVVEDFRPNDVITFVANGKLPQPRPAGLRPRGLQRWRRRCVCGPLGSGNRRIRLRLEPPDRPDTAGRDGIQRYRHCRDPRSARAWSVCTSTSSTPIRPLATRVRPRKAARTRS